jgi:uncharacterized protein (DUF58 family)
LLRDILFFEPARQGTDLRAGLDYLNKVQQRRAIVFLISDFADEGYERAFRFAGRKHDLVAICVTDPREHELADAGLIQLRDAETGDSILIDSSSPHIRLRFAAQVAVHRERLRKLARSAQVDLIEVGTDGKHFDALVRFFRVRERRRRHE